MLHVTAEQVPVIHEKGHRVRVVLGRSAEVTGAEATPEPLTLLDGYLHTNGASTHVLPQDFQDWVYVVNGTLTLRCETEERSMAGSHATTVSAGAQSVVVMNASEPCHFVMIAGKPIGEPLIKRGPLVMSSEEDIRQTLAKYANGGFGQIPT